MSEEFMDAALKLAAAAEALMRAKSMSEERRISINLQAALRRFNAALATTRATSGPSR
jgi:hypothetical protein